MKISPDYVRRNIVDETVIIPTGKAIQYFNGIISTNQVAGFIWKHLEECETPDEIVNKVLEVFDVDKETATKDIYEFLDNLKAVGMIVD